MPAAILDLKGDRGGRKTRQKSVRWFISVLRACPNTGMDYRSVLFITLHSSCSTCGSSSVFFSNICLFQPWNRSLMFSLGAGPVELKLSAAPYGRSFRQRSVMLWMASALSRWRNFIWTCPTPNTICREKHQYYPTSNHHQQLINRKYVYSPCFTGIIWSGVSHSKMRPQDVLCFISYCLGTEFGDVPNMKKKILPNFTAVFLKKTLIPLSKLENLRVQSGPWHEDINSK